MPEIKVYSSSRDPFTIVVSERDANPNELSREERDEILRETYRGLNTRPEGTIHYLIAGKQFRFEDIRRGSSSDPRVVEASPDAYQENLPHGRLGNMRAHDHRSIKAFRWRQGGIDVRSEASLPKYDVDENIVRFLLKTRVRLPVNANILEATVLRAYDYSIQEKRILGNELILEGVAQIPAQCDVNSERRTMIQLKVKWQDAEGIHEQHVPIEQSCLLGDTGVNATLEAILTSALNLPSVECDQIAREIREKLLAEKRELNLQNAYRALVDWLKARDARFIADPLVGPMPYTRSQTYYLRPAETLRFNGDCEDWAILGAAVMLRLGFEAWPAKISDTHLVTLAQEAKAGSPLHYLDLTADLPRAEHSE